MTTQVELQAAVDRFYEVWHRVSKRHFGDRELVAGVRPLLLLASEAVVQRVIAEHRGQE